MTSPHPTIPVADWVTRADLVSDPYAVYARLREESPVCWVPAVNKVLITKFNDCIAAEQNPDVFSSHMSYAHMIVGMGGRPMIRKDGTDHAKERKAVNSAVRPRFLSEIWVERFEANTDFYLDQLENMGPDEADLNRDFAEPLAAKNLMDLLGFDKTDVKDFARWSADFMAGNANVGESEEIWARCERTRAEAHAALDELLPRLRESPNNSVASHMIASGMPEESIRVNLFLAISGGVNEPQHAITNTVLLLSEHPEFVPDLTKPVDETAEQWNRIFHEVLRYYSPIAMVTRETHQDIDFAGVHIPNDTQIGVMLASGNRDASAFTKPDSFDVNREETVHIAFGEGPHMCAGMWVAEAAIGRIAIPKLYQRFTDLRIDDRREIEWEGFIFRGMSKTPVTWSAVQGDQN